MTDKEALSEIARQEKRFASVNGGRGSMLVKSARDYFALLKEAEKKVAAIEGKYKAAKQKLAKLEVAAAAADKLAKAKATEAAKLRSEMVGVRKIIKSGERVKCKEGVARHRLVEKIERLKTMPLS